MSGDQSGPIELNGTGGGGDGGVNGVVTNGTPGDGTMNGGEATTPGGGGGSESGGLGSLIAVDAGCSEGPSSIIGVGPPSPLTGCYLLIIIGEPHSQDHKDIILQRLIKGKLQRILLGGGFCFSGKEILYVYCVTDDEILID